MRGIVYKVLVATALPLRVQLASKGPHPTNSIAARCRMLGNERFARACYHVLSQAVRTRKVHVPRYHAHHTAIPHQTYHS